jgi:phosphoglycerate kinase
VAYKTLDDLDLAQKRVLVRVDINVPVHDGKVTDDTRMRAIIPTLKDILAAGGRPILLAHFGRPKGKPVPELSLAPLAEPLQELLGSKVTFVEQPRDPEPGETLLVENTRFTPMEEANDPRMADYLASCGDVYVNDAFSASHRAHASTEGVARRLPSAAGRLMQKELEALEKALANPERPVIAVVGGAKVSTKLELLGNLIDKARARGCELVLASDVVVAREFRAGAASEVVAATECPADAMILDTGPASVEDIEARFVAAKTVVWNGPLGAFEIEPFNAATDAAARTVADLTQAGKLLSVAGGGDTVAALNASGSAARFSYVSTAGGAFLEWLEGKTLPGVAALEAAG